MILLDKCWFGVFHLFVPKKRRDSFGGTAQTRESTRGKNTHRREIMCVMFVLAEREKKCVASTKELKLIEMDFVSLIWHSVSIFSGHALNLVSRWRSHSSISKWFSAIGSPDTKQTNNICHSKPLKNKHKYVRQFVDSIENWYASLHEFVRLGKLKVNLNRTENDSN